jgi:hypothetical protein
MRAGEKGGFCAPEEEMVRVCPNPATWTEVFWQLTQYARIHQCSPPSPPVALILAGWHFTNDVEKATRWEETVAWAERNACVDLVDVPGEDFYCVEVLSSRFIPE